MEVAENTPEIDLILPDGVYFNMEADDYHKLKRLSNSAMQKLDIGAAEFWSQSWLNPDREDKKTAAMLYGRAYHTAALEPEKFNDTVAPEFDDECLGKGAVTNGEQIAKALETLGQPKTLKGENVEEKALRLADAGYPASKIKHLAGPLYNEDNAGKTLLPRASIDDIKRDIEAMERYPEIVKYLRMGFSEVTILWTDEKTGEKMKARLDRVWGTGFSDLKTFDNMMDKKVRNCILDAIKYKRYHMQAATYFKALELWRAGELHLRGKYTEDQLRLFTEITQNPRRMECWWIWQQKKGVPNFIATRMQTHKYDLRAHRANDAGIDEAKSIAILEKTAKPSDWFLKGVNEARNAVSVYQLAMEVYGEEKPWNDINPVYDVTDDHFSSFWLEE